MIAWFDRTPGSAVGQSTEDPTMLLVGADHPDWVRAPAELGGAELRVARIYEDDCVCGERHTVRHYDFEASELHVAECPSGFKWYRLKETT